MTEIDLEQGVVYGYNNHRRSFVGSDVSVYYTDGEQEEEEDVTSCYSYFYSTNGGGTTYEFEGGGDESRKVSSVSASSSVIDIEDETAETEKDCRICHLGVGGGGGAMELGCSCKDDLAVAHRQCAETWFKIKGDKICEICHSVARNLGGANETVGSILEDRDPRNSGGEGDFAAVPVATAIENRWKPQRVVNIVLACMVCGFFMSWFFHFHVSSSS